MLVLTRKDTERILIGDNIEVVLVETWNGGAKIGVIAPRTITVNREEITREVEAEEQARRDAETAKQKKRHLARERYKMAQARLRFNRLNRHSGVRGRVEEGENG